MTRGLTLIILAFSAGSAVCCGGDGATTPSSTRTIPAHANQNCADTAPRRGAGRFYCFAP
jgi:hypothetical protein